MAWVPAAAWLTKLTVDIEAADLGFDLAVDASGRGRPSPVAAGLVSAPASGGRVSDWVVLPVAGGVLFLAGYLVMRSRAAEPRG